MAELSDTESCVVVGTVLGDGCLKPSGRRNAVLSLCHGEKQLDYLKLKMNSLPSLDFTPVRRYVNKRNGGVYYQVVSRATPSLRTIYEEMYPGGKKKIRPSLINSLPTLSLALWYSDDGTTNKDDRPGFNASDRATLLVAMRDIVDPENIMRALVSRVGNCSLNPAAGGKKYWLFRFDSAASQKLAAEINRYLLVWLPHKLIRLRRTNKQPYVHGGVSFQKA